jgi:hypothetical protein
LTISDLSSRQLLKSAGPPRPNAPTTSAAPASVKAPAKGSYAEILVRGKASQPKDIMKILNKKAPEPKLQRGKRMLDRDRSGSWDREVQSTGEGGESATAKRRPDEYKCNARSSSSAVVSRSAKPVYSGTAGLKRPDSSSGPCSKKARYTCEDDDEVEEADNYDSKASSDMEANVFNVDQEEEMSTRAARKEDTEELARLHKHDRQKK